MTCERCGGLQLRSHFANVKSSVGAWEYDGWLCMNCGEIVDPLILSNRSRQHVIANGDRVRPFGGKVMWVPSQEDAVA